MRRWVVDASPLIFLAKLDRLSLLRSRADETLVPHAVLDEIRAHDDTAAARIEVARGDWLKARRGPEAGPFGELAVIELALEVAAERAVLDDLAARRLARSRGLDVIGTLGILLAARLDGEIDSLADEIDHLAGLGFRIGDDLVRRALEAAGEG